MATWTSVSAPGSREPAPIRSNFLPRVVGLFITAMGLWPEGEGQLPLYGAVRCRNRLCQFRDVYFSGHGSTAAAGGLWSAKAAQAIVDRDARRRHVPIPTLTTGQRARYVTLCKRSRPLGPGTESEV